MTAVVTVVVFVVWGLFCYWLGGFRAHRRAEKLTFDNLRFRDEERENRGP